ncbi:MAG: DUF3617 domain-containing protein [Acidobacteriota bacterium]|nr:DUF3617 domain-containing protein [Acidobacteriota bacterium]
MRVSSMVLAVVSAFALLATPPASAADLMRPGLWENLTFVDAPNNPGKAPGRKASRCYTAKELAGLNARDANAVAAYFAGPNPGKCTIRDMKFTGNHATWTTDCGGDVMHSDTTFHGDSMESVVKAESVTIHMTSRRIGDCK